MVKELITRRILSWIGILLFLFLISGAVYSYVSTQSKIRLIDATLGVMQGLVSEKNILISISSTLLQISNFAVLQVIIFFIMCLFLIIILGFLFKLYLVQKRNAFIDSLSGLYNREALRLSLKNEIDRAKLFNHHLCLAVVDVDNFARYNSFFSFDLGDKALRKIGDIIKKSVRNIDIVGRIGSDEFWIIFPETDYKTALKICSKLQETIAKEPFGDSLNEDNITVSMGLMEYSKRHQLRDSNLVEEANRKLYFAKLAGKNLIR